MNWLVKPFLKRSAIFWLFFSRNPTAIFWCVISIYIITLYRKMVQIAMSHSPFPEWDEFIPRITNRDSPASIIFVILLFLITASGMHCTPYIIEAGASPSVFAHASNGTTRKNVAYSQIFSSYVFNDSAVAKTIPKRFTPNTFPISTEYQKSSVALAGHVNVFEAGIRHIVIIS